MILIGFTQKMGRVDVKSIEDYKRRNDVEKVLCSAGKNLWKK